MLFFFIAMMANGRTPLVYHRKVRAGKHTKPKLRSKDCATKGDTTSKMEAYEKGELAKKPSRSDVENLKYCKDGRLQIWGANKCPGGARKLNDLRRMWRSV